MEKISVKSKAICTLPNPTVAGQACTATCGVTNWGTTMFVLKSRGSANDNKLYPISLIKISKYNSSPSVKTITVKKNSKELGNVAKHANSICYARAEGESSGSLFVTTGNKKNKVQVIKMNSSGKVEKELYYYGPDGQKSTISLITYYGMKDGKMMFITNGNAKDGRKKYNLSYFDGSNLRFYKSLCYGEDTDSSDYTSNDITYQNGKLYHTFFKKSGNIIKYNRIYVYDLSNIDSLNGQIISAEKMIQSNASSTYNKKYEIEGVITYNNVMYAATNSESSTASKNKDTIFKLE